MTRMMRIYTGIFIDCIFSKIRVISVFLRPFLFKWISNQIFSLLFIYDGDSFYTVDYE